MVRSLVVAVLVAASAAAADPKPEDQLPRTLKALHENKVSVKPGSLKGASLRNVISVLELQFKEDGLKIVVREEMFRISFPDIQILDMKFAIETEKVNGLTLNEFLTYCLWDLNAVHVVRKGVIEITTPTAAVSEFFPKGNKRAKDSERAALKHLARSPLVSYVATEQPFQDAMREIAARYDKTVAFDPDIGVRRKEPVTARILNQPYPTAVKLLALEAGLDVTEIDGVLVVTVKGANPKPKRK